MKSNYEIYVKAEPWHAELGILQVRAFMYGNGLADSFGAGRRLNY